MSPARRQSPLEKAVKREIEAAAKRAKRTGKPWSAELALTLVHEIEGADPESTLAARVSAAKVLLETMERVSGEAPAEPAVDRLDELSSRRELRRGAK